MFKKKYFYNKETLRFEKIETPFSKKLKGLSLYLVIVILLSVVLRVAIDQMSSSPKVIYYTQKNQELKNNYKEIQNEIVRSESLLEEIQKRDDKVYRSALKMEPMPGSVREAGFGGSKTLSERIGIDVITKTMTYLEKLSTRALVQSWSLRDLYKAARQQKKLNECKPSIQPLSPADSFWLTSTYGNRRDPFNGYRRMHMGIDLAGEIGLKVHATGNGKVINAENSKSGYGKEVVIDHGFGYSTRYAHLTKISVKQGQKVVRGQVLGELGNTGRSTGPHLHYEILYNGTPVNPMYFYIENVSPDEYSLITSRNNPAVDNSAGLTE